MALPTRTKSNYEKFNIQINIDMANLLLDYVMSNKPSRMHLANLKQFMDVLNMNAYDTNYDIKDRLSLIKRILDAKINMGLKKLPLIKEKIKESDPDLADVIEKVTWTTDAVSGTECSTIRDWVDEKMQYYFYYLEMPTIVDIWQKCIDKGF